MNPECVTCRRLGTCDVVTPEHILAHYVCPKWEEVESPAQVQARCDVINQFGVTGMQAMLAPRVQEDEEA